MLQRWQVIGNTVSDLTGPRFELQTYHSRDECVTAQPTDRFNNINIHFEFFKRAGSAISRLTVELNVQI